MPAVDLLHIRRGEHDALFGRIVTLLEHDERVVAAWLFGSRGRRTADDLSDTDLWVVVSDEQGDVVIAERRAFVARVGEPALVLEIGDNAPPRGAYLMVLYPGEAGPHQVDWYWQHQTNAAIPRHAVILFNRGAVPGDARVEQLDPPLHVHQEQRDRICFMIAYFWAMSNIAVKGALRHFDPWSATSTINMLRGILDDTHRFVDPGAAPRGQENWRATLRPPATARAQIALLRATAREMEALMPRVEALGGQLQWAAIPYIHAFFDMADVMLEEEKQAYR